MEQVSASVRMTVTIDGLERAAAALARRAKRGKWRRERLEREVGAMVEDLRSRGRIKVQAY